MIKYTLQILLISMLVTSCSNIKPYEMHGKNNLIASSKTDDDVEAAIDIYHVDKACKYNYKGTITLENGINKISLTENRLNYLVVSFSTSSFWASSSSSMSQDMMIKPNKNYNYKLDLSYIDNIYNVELKKTKLRSKKTIEVDITAGHKCLK